MNISVIIPVYNVEKYLCRCLDSVISQTISSIEAIIVNDGSVDRSQKIIDKYAQRYPGKIKAYQKENGGLGSARNFGLNVATGEFIGFIDSDDYARSDMFEKMYFNIKKQKAEIAICNNYLLDESENHTASVNFRSFPDFSNVDKLSAHRYGGTEAWNKLFHRSLFEETGIRFPDGLFEDFATIPFLIEAAEKIIYIDEPLIYYVLRKGSIMDSALSGKFQDKNYDIFKQSRRLISLKERFSHRSYQLFIDDILPTFIFLKFYLFILSIKDRKNRERNISCWGRELKAILPDWYHSLAIERVIIKTNSIFRKIFFKTILSAFAYGKIFPLEMLLLFGGKKLVKKQIWKIYGK